MCRTTCALLFACLWANPCASQGCEDLKLATATDAVNALDHVEIKTAFCSRSAFQVIENLPQEQAVPILIKYLGFRRPTSNEAHGLRSQYPAVDALAKLGLAAEPALIDFIARQEDDNSVQRANALEALGLLRRGDVVPTIKLLREHSAALAGTPPAARLDSAAKYLLKTFCPGKRLQKCEEGLQESDEDK
jgi:HEAT repeat protein